MFGAIAGLVKAATSTVSSAGSALKSVGKYAQKGVQQLQRGDGKGSQGAQGAQSGQQKPSIWVQRTNMRPLQQRRRRNGGRS